MGIVLALAVGGAAWGAGQRDKGFGKNGLDPAQRPGGNFDLLTDLALLPGGKILAVGARDSSAGLPSGPLQGAIGRPDRSFDGDGIFVQPFNGGALEPRGLKAMDVDSKGRIVAAGLASGPCAGFDAFGFARYRPNGLPDTAFGDGGIRIVQPLDFGQRQRCRRRARRQGGCGRSSPETIICGESRSPWCVSPRAGSPTRPSAPVAAEAGSFDLRRQRASEADAVKVLAKRLDRARR